MAESQRHRKSQQTLTHVHAAIGDFEVRMLDNAEGTYIVHEFSTLELVAFAKSLYGDVIPERVEAMKADAERLDWLEKTGRTVFLRVDGLWVVDKLGEQESRGPTPRDAIDAAMQKEVK